MLAPQMAESPQDKRFVGGFVTGITRAVRNSLKRSQRTEPPLPQYAQPPQLRDSGYAGSTSQLNPPPPTAPPQDFRSPSSPTHESPARPPSETVLGHPPPNPKLHDQTTVITPQKISPPEPMGSPVPAELKRDRRYKKYPREMGGYVPYEFAEHYYGDKYGPGVDAVRPPLPGAPSSAVTSTASPRQQRQPPIPVSSPRGYP